MTVKDGRRTVLLVIALMGLIWFIMPAQKPWFPPVIDTRGWPMAYDSSGDPLDIDSLLTAEGFTVVSK